MNGSLVDAWRDAWLPLLLLSVVLTLSVRALRWYRRFRRSGIARRALGAEQVALGLLRAHGYVVLDTQVRQRWPVHHGAHAIDIALRADALVRRGERRFVAEVKSTSLVADLRHGPTRRQLLEYAIAYGTDGVLLVDMHTRRIEEISFPGLWRTRRHRSLSSTALLVVALAVAALAVGVWMGATGILIPRVQ